MKTYMIDPLHKEEIVTVIKAIQGTVSKDDTRPVLQGFHVETRDDKTILYATDGFRLLKWETESYVLAEEEGTRIPTGTYQIVTADFKNEIMVLEDIEGNYPDCDAIIPTGDKYEPCNKLAFDPTLLYNMVKPFKSGVRLEWHSNREPLIIYVVNSYIEGLTMLLMPRTLE